MTPSILVWARGLKLANPYSRDRVIFALLKELGCQLVGFSPSISAIGAWQAQFLRWPSLRAVWVPCFRHRDLHAAACFARRRHLPLIFDPLISAYDKQVNERRKYPSQSRQAHALLVWERGLLANADLVLADTVGHANYFESVLGVKPERIRVLPVGADEAIFQPSPLPLWPVEGRSVRLVFYGSFIGLHGVSTIVDALGAYRGPPVEVQFIGQGPHRAETEARMAALPMHPSVRKVTFHDWLPIAHLASKLADADLVLGIFGTSGKALRVVPNKVYQALAVGRPVITADTPAFGALFRQHGTAPLAFTPPGDGVALARQIAEWAVDPPVLSRRGEAASTLYRENFSSSVLLAQLADALQSVFPAIFKPTLGPLM